jgi:penicillin-binding protein 1A
MGIDNNMRALPFFKKCLWLLLAALILLGLGLTFFVTYLEYQLPNVLTLKNRQLQAPLRIYTTDGQLMGEFGTKRRRPISLKAIPKQFIEAALATEDSRYFSHGGVDIFGLGRAALVLITTGRKAQGGSTITMQVARNYFLTRKKTYLRKMREILLAIKINQLFTKDQVLTLYFNKIFYGNRAYGIAAAATTYYGKTINQLTLAQMAMLAGLPKAPSTINPLANPQAAIRRRNHVLKRMLEQQYITQQTYQQTLSAPVTAKYHGPKIKVRAPYVIEMIRKSIIRQYGKIAYQQGLQVYTTITSTDQTAANQALFNGVMAYDRRHGYRGVLKNLGPTAPQDFTSWHLALQSLPKLSAPLRYAVVFNLTAKNATVLTQDDHIMTLPWSGLSWARTQRFQHAQEYLGTRPTHPSDILAPGDVIVVYQGKHHAWLAQSPQAEAALVAISPENGAILALAGGFSYRTNQFNHVTQAYRQPGSSFKPFIYSAALAKGFSLSSLVNDAPIVIENQKNNQLWRPENDTRKFYGLTSLAEGLIKSRNLLSIRLLQRIGVKYARNYATRFGFHEKQLPQGLSLALGTATVSPLQMAAGYAVFANNGYKITPHLIDSVALPNGHIIYQSHLPKACPTCANHPDLIEKTTPLAPQVITPQNAFLMTQALKGVILHGTGRAALILKRSDLAGKTGTTNEKQDAWFAGYNEKLVAITWVGFDKPRPLYEFGAQAALPLWIDFMHSALKNQPLAQAPQLPNLISVRIDPKTNQLASANQNDAQFALFRTQYAPTRQASAHPQPSQSKTEQDDLEQQLYR